MPRKNTVRRFTEEGFYHIYNRGVEKRDIFLDEQDYAVFLHLIKYYLSPINPNNIHPLMEFQNFKIVRPRPLANIEKDLDLIAFCLMPNHFHLLIKQHTKDGVTKFLIRLLTTYAVYFNKRYDRVGYLFQGPYRAIFIENEAYLLHLSRYIHLNPLELTRGPLVSYPYSSYPYYLGEKHAVWLKPEAILSFFNKTDLLPFLYSYPSYQKFVEDYPKDPKEIIGKLALE